MKKILFVMAALLMVSLCASSQERQEAGKGKRTLVAYFSASGVTEGVAKQLAEVAGADLFKIEPAQPYSSADLDWRNKESRSSVEMKDKASRPALRGKDVKPDTYDVIYVGFPIWWNTAPRIINTFMESYDFKGKTVIPFATSGSSNIKNSCDDLKAAYPGVHWEDGRLLNHTSREEIENWVNGIDIPTEKD